MYLTVTLCRAKAQSRRDDDELTDVAILDLYENSESRMG